MMRSGRPSQGHSIGKRTHPSRAPSPLGGNGPWSGSHCCEAGAEHGGTIHTILAKTRSTCPHVRRSLPPAHPALAQADSRHCKIVACFDYGRVRLSERTQCCELFASLAPARTGG